MSNLYVTPPSIESLISTFIEWAARNMKARITVEIYWHEGRKFTEIYEGRESK